MIFDAHVHLFKLGSAGAIDEAEFAMLLRRMGQCQIDRCLLLGAVIVNPYPTREVVRRMNDHTAAAIARAPDRLSGFCYINPEHDAKFNLDEMNRCILDGPMIGVKFWIAVNAANDAAHDEVMRHCEKLDCPVLYHSWHKTVGQLPQESTPADVAHLAQRHRNVRIIMAHMMGGGVRGVSDVADCPNVWIDTSGSQPEAGVLEHALQAVGARRIIYGSDFPGRDFATQRGKIEAVELCEQDREDIYWRNLQRVLTGRWPC